MRHYSRRELRVNNRSRRLINEKCVTSVKLDLEDNARPLYLRALLGEN